ncbi:MAG: hypothetical protein CMH34_09945 [Microbacterium sp.]|nr:hypothetical protein [Microbacterium sp.]
MTTLIHKSPLGALEIPGVLGAPKPGEPFDVTFEEAAALLDQADLYAVAGGWDALTASELETIARRRGVALTSKKKPDIIAALNGEPIAADAADEEAS